MISDVASRKREYHRDASHFVKNNIKNKNKIAKNLRIETRPVKTSWIP